GIARAYRRGHGADPACLEGTATLRLARKALPLPDVLVWPKPLQQPLPPMYALGTSREASDFAARNHIGLGVSFGPFDAMGKVTGYYKRRSRTVPCARSSCALLLSRPGATRRVRDRRRAATSAAAPS